MEFQVHHQSFQSTFKTDFLYDGLVGLPCSPRDFQESSPTPQYKSINYSALSLLYGPTLTSIHDYWKNYHFDIQTFVGKVISLLFNMLYMFDIAFFPRRKHLLVLCWQSPSAMILEHKKLKFLTVSMVPQLYALKLWDQMP